jgi:hypothetical protein
MIKRSAQLSLIAFTLVRASLLLREARLRDAETKAAGVNNLSCDI